MLALLHALERPAGLLSVVAADSPSSIPAFVAGCNELLDAMEPDVSATIRAGERSGETSTPEFQAAVMEFYKRHVCRPIRGPRRSCAASTRWRATRPSTGP